MDGKRDGDSVIGDKNSGSSGGGGSGEILLNHPSDRKPSPSQIKRNPPVSHHKNDHNSKSLKSSQSDSVFGSPSSAFISEGVVVRSNSLEFNNNNNNNEESRNNENTDNDRDKKSGFGCRNEDLSSMPAFRRFQELKRRQELEKEADLNI